MKLPIIALLGLLLCPLQVLGQTIVQVVGLFPSAAVIVVDGQRQLVKVGEVGPAGVKVIYADSKGARLLVDGVERNYELGRDYSNATSVNTFKRSVIAKGNGGHYWAAGSINGRSIQFMVDTGASIIAMNEEHAKRLGLDYENGVPSVANTASGTAKGWRIHLNEVKVGEIVVLGVEAMVIEGGAPSEPLLGMSFLSRIRFHVDQDALVLESKI